MMASPPVYNPQIPYLGIIPGGFQPGRMVKIQGNVLPTANRFAINLLCGPNMNSGDDIALHLNPRFNDNRIIRNSMQRMMWQQEEFHANTMPLARGQGFEIVILCDSHQFKIAINGQHFAEFVHRLPVQRVTHMAIEGDVTISLINVEGGQTMGGGFGPTAPVAGFGQPQGMGGGIPGQPAGGLYPNLPGPGVSPYPSQPAPGAYGQPAAPGYGQPGYQQPYPGYGQQPGYPGQAAGYPGQAAGYPGQTPGQYPSNPSGYNSYQQYPSQPPRQGLGGLLDQAGAALAGALGSTGLMRGGAHHGHHGVGMGTAMGAGMGGAALAGHGHMSSKQAHKAAKKQAKAQKKAMKYGLPVAGVGAVGVGAYGLHKHHKHKHGHHGHHGKSSSSSSSSSEEE